MSKKKELKRLRKQLREAKEINATLSRMLADDLVSEVLDQAKRIQELEDRWVVQDERLSKLECKLGDVPDAVLRAFSNFASGVRQYGQMR